MFIMFDPLKVWLKLASTLRNTESGIGSDLFLNELNDNSLD